MAPQGGSGKQPWYRTPAATFTAGGVGAALIAALVFTVVQMSDEWSRPQNTVFTTPVTTQSAPTTETRDKEPFVITPSDTSTTFTTSVPLSTTEIGIPPEATTSGTETTTESSSQATSAPSGTDMPTTYPSQRRPGDDSDTPRPTRNRPRYNETRTYIPG